MSHMKIDNGYRLAACDGKQKLTIAQARRAAKRMRYRGIVAEAYKCPVCGRWHVGSKAI